MSAQIRLYDRSLFLWSFLLLGDQQVFGGLMSLWQWARKIDDGVVSKTRKERELCQSGVMKGVIIQPQSERKTLSMFFRVHHVCWVLSSKFMNISISGQEGLSPCFFKVHIFWEGHKILQNFHRRFDHYFIGQIYGGDFAKICGLLRLYELYPV